MALEQLIDSHGVDIRADIYSLGATLSFCLTGKAPPRAGVPTPEGGPRAPADLYDVLRKMMAQEPEHRYQTPAEVAEAAARWVPGAAPRARKRPARRPAAPA